MAKRLERKVGPAGAYLVRAAYRAEDYVTPAQVLAQIETWRSDPWPTEALLEMRDGPYTSWALLRRFERDGKDWVLLRHPYFESAIEVELSDQGPGRVVPLPPEEAWRLAREADRLRPEPTILEGEHRPD